MYSLAVTKEYIVCGTYENQVQVRHCKVRQRASEDLVDKSS